MSLKLLPPNFVMVGYLKEGSDWINKVDFVCVEKTFYGNFFESCALNCWNSSRKQGCEGFGSSSKNLVYLVCFCFLPY
jgi:hypothetical protein